MGDGWFGQRRESDPDAEGFDWRFALALIAFALAVVLIVAW